MSEGDKMKAVPYIVMVLFCVGLFLAGQMRGSYSCQLKVAKAENVETVKQVKSDEKVQQKVVRMPASAVTKQLLSKWMRD